MARHAPRRDGDEIAALRAARGRAQASEADLEAIVASLPFAVAATYGGHSSCVEIENRLYDKDGRLTATVNGLGEVVRYGYDASGNVIDRIAYANRLAG